MLIPWNWLQAGLGKMTTMWLFTPASPNSFGSQIFSSTRRWGTDWNYVKEVLSTFLRKILFSLSCTIKVKLRAPTLHTKPTSLRLYRDGRIRYSTRYHYPFSRRWTSYSYYTHTKNPLCFVRVNYDVACAMDFHFYPHDVQTCHVRCVLVEIYFASTSAS